MTVESRAIVEEERDDRRCPTTRSLDCAMCSVEYCAVHARWPCECDVVDRHFDPNKDKP